MTLSVLPESQGPGDLGCGLLGSSKDTLQGGDTLRRQGGFLHCPPTQVPEEPGVASCPTAIRAEEQRPTKEGQKITTAMHFAWERGGSIDRIQFAIHRPRDVLVVGFQGPRLHIEVTSPAESGAPVGCGTST